MATIWLIRHGESVSNAGGITKSYYENPLTEKGQQQVLKLGKRFSSLHPTKIIHSSYLRAQQTSQPIRERHPNVPVETWPIHEFRLISPRLYEGFSANDRASHRITYWEHLDPDYRDHEESESFIESLERVKQFKHRCEKEFKQDDNVVIIGHGLFYRAFLWWFQNSSIKDESQIKRLFHHYSQSLRLPNTGIIKCYLDFTNEGPEWFAGTFDTKHLS